MSPEDRLLFAKIVLKNNLASEEDVKACIREAEEQATSSKKVPITEIFLRRRLLEKAQVRAVLDALRQTHRVQSLSKKIPNYQFLTELGRGTAGIVYLARQLHIGREVAIKVLNEDLAANPEFIEKFRKEAKSAARLNHPNIIQAIDVGQSEEVHFFVMEYVEGESVQRILKRESRIDEARAADIALQAAKGLQHAHKYGLIHRDIKPGNILVNTQGVAKLCDLGLARPAGSHSSTTTSSRTAGTPAYMSPEQALGKRDLDIRTDLYSLGATLYHAVTGKIPFLANNLPDLLSLLIKGKFKPPREVCADLHAGMEQLIVHLMATDRDRRPESPEAVRQMLEGLLAQLPPAPPLALLTSTGQKMVPPLGQSKTSKFLVPALVVTSGADAGKRFVLSRSRMVVGRHSSTDIHLHDAWISRYHFRILQHGDSFHLESLQESNPTELNGRPVKKAAIQPGDVISIYKTTMRFEFDIPRAEGVS